MEWLKKLLGVVLQQNTNVFVVMHAPLKIPGTDKMTDGGEELKAMLLGKLLAGRLNHTGQIALCHSHTPKVTQKIRSSGRGR